MIIVMKADSSELNRIIELALCDGPQALTLDDLDELVDDMAVVRRAYEERLRLRRPRVSARRGVELSG